MRLSLFIIICCLIVNTALAEDTYSIDKSEQEALDKAISTSDMVDATYEALKQWESEMDKYYNKLIKVLSKEAQEAFKESQEAWVEFRDAEFKAVVGLRDGLQGTMHIPIAASNEKEIIKQRALTLKWYYQYLLEHKE